MMLDIKALFKRKEADSLDSEGAMDADNIATHQRNWVVFAIAMLILGLSYVAFTLITAPPKPVTVDTPPEFGAVITPDFSDKDTQSALQAQQQDINRLSKAVSDLTRQRDRLSGELERSLEKLTKKLDETVTQVQDQLDNNVNMMQIELDNRIESHRLNPAEGEGNKEGDNANMNPFGADHSGSGEFNNGYQPRQSVGIQTFSYRWPSDPEKPYRRTSKNYVPTGSFVTAILIGAADANAGVNGQGDTAPILFRTIHDGILPNGKRSRINDCFVTAAVYGEISSNRGIARLQRMSCIFDNNGEEEIIDMPVKGTAFNFGRNGIRGTPVMRNGKIVQMAGISGMFTGLGDTAKNASSSTITGTSGVVSTVNPSDALMNMGGAALENIGSKLADYYIKLAEQYHPIIELNPGAIVNLVFLEGFPLDADKIAEYEQRETESATRLMETFSNPVMNMMGAGQVQGQTAPINPLANQLLPELKAKAQAFDSLRQRAPQQPY